MDNISFFFLLSTSGECGCDPYKKLFLVLCDKNLLHLRQ